MTNRKRPSRRTTQDDGTLTSAQVIERRLDLVNRAEKSLAGKRLFGASTSREMGLWFPQGVEPTDDELTEFEGIADEVIPMLRAADVYRVSKDMVCLMAAGANDLPDDASIPLDLVPSPFGFVRLDEPFMFTHIVPDKVFPKDERVGDIIPVNWIFWYTFVDPNDQIVFFSCFFQDITTDHGAVRREYAKSFGSWWSIGATFVPESASLGPVATKDGRINARPLYFRPLISLWTMMQQEFVETPKQLVCSSRAIKQHRRVLNTSTDPTVRTIKLKRSGSHSGDGSGSSDYHHSWLVRGHWRNQAYGEGRQLRKRIWISPHVKGPADKPLLTGQKVHLFSGPN